MAGWKQQQKVQMYSTESPDVCRPVPPFWWMGLNPGQPTDVELSNAYETTAKFQEVDRVDVVNEMKLDDVGEYLPGEMANNQKAPLQVQQGYGIYAAAVGANAGAHCAVQCGTYLEDPNFLFKGNSTKRNFTGLVQWTPKSPDFYKPFDPDSVPRSPNYLYSSVKRRQMMDMASTLREDSDYSAKDCVPMCAECQVTPSTQVPYGAVASPPVWPMSSHPVNEFDNNTPSPATLTRCQRIIEATSAHIAGTNPFCFRDVIGRN